MMESLILTNSKGDFEKSSVNKNLTFNSRNNIFNLTLEKLCKDKTEKIYEIPLIELYPPEFHPFQINHDEAFNRLVENIKLYGVREPGLARSRKNGGYELLCGNRRKYACELIGKKTMPVIIRELDDDNAILSMIDSNLKRREKILLSEKAQAYKMKMEVLNHKGVKNGKHSADIIAEQTGESRNKIFKLIRLTELINDLIDRVDSNRLAFNPAVELSYLSLKEQTAVASAMDKYDIKPSLSQAVRLKKLKQNGILTLDIIDDILSEIKAPLIEEPLEKSRYRKYFPPDFSMKQIDCVITSLLKNWQINFKNV